MFSPIYLLECNVVGNMERSRSGCNSELGKGAMIRPNLVHTSHAVPGLKLGYFSTYRLDNTRDIIAGVYRLLVKDWDLPVFGVCT